MPESNQVRWFGVRPVNPPETFPVTDIDATLAVQYTLSIDAGASGNIDVQPPAGEVWRIRYTNQHGSGADISLDEVLISPDGGTTFYHFGAAHLDNDVVVLDENSILRFTFSNGGTAAEDAILNVFGEKLKV